LFFKVYPNGIRIGGFSNGGGFGGVRGTRQIVTAFSEASRKRLDWVYLNGNWKSMLTLTYHTTFPKDFRVVKKQLNLLLQHLRIRGVRYLWVVEWQGRGFPHLHIWLDRVYDDVPREDDIEGENSWRPLMRVWLRIAGLSSDEQAVSFGLHQVSYCNWTVDVKSKYASKYGSKNQQKVLPDGIVGFGRWWGCSRGLKLETSEYFVDSADPVVVAACVQARRQVKKFIERKCSGFRFSRDRWESLYGVRWTMTPERVACVKRLFTYYLKRSLVRNDRGTDFFFDDCIWEYKGGAPFYSRVVALCAAA
jgi:hypothetical protein